MATNDYHFITHWRVEGNINEVADILRNAKDLPRWWPSVYLEVKELEPGDSEGILECLALAFAPWATSAALRISVE